MWISKTGLLCLRHTWVRYEDKISDVSVSNQNIATICDFMLTLTEVTNLFTQVTKEIVKDECM